MKKRYLLYSIIGMLSLSPSVFLASDSYYTNDSSHFDYFSSSEYYVSDSVKTSEDGSSSLTVYKLKTEDNADDIYRVVFENGSLSSLMTLLSSYNFKDSSLDLVVLPSVTFDRLDITNYSSSLPIIPTLYIDSLTIDSLDDVSIMIRDFKSSNVFINSIPDIESINANGGDRLNQYLSFFEENAGIPFTFSDVPDSFLDKLSQYNSNISSESVRNIKGDEENVVGEAVASTIMNMISENGEINDFTDFTNFLGVISGDFTNFVGGITGLVPVNPDEMAVIAPDDRDLTFSIKDSPFGVSGPGYLNFFISWVPNFSLKPISEDSSDFYKVLPLSFEGSSKEYAPFIQVVDIQPFNSIWNLSLKATPFTSERSLDELKGSIISLNQYKIIAATNNGDFVSGDKPLDPINLNNDMYTLMTKEDAVNKGVWTFSFSNSPAADYEENSVVFAINKDHMNKKETYVSDFTWIYYNTPL